MPTHTLRIQVLVDVEIGPPRVRVLLAAVESWKQNHFEASGG